jgi:hypothetical protein
MSEPLMQVIALRDINPDEEVFVPFVRQSTILLIHFQGIDCLY